MFKKSDRHNKENEEIAYLGSHLLNLHHRWLQALVKLHPEVWDVVGQDVSVKEALEAFKEAGK